MKKETGAHTAASAGKRSKAADKVRAAAASTRQAMIDQLDQDGNGQIDSVDIILMGMKVPGVRINRADFLQKELFKNHPQSVIDKAIATTPALAGISEKEIDKIADDVIQFERNAVSGISTVLGVPGGVAMVATIPADMAQYYGYMLRAAQKLLYLYGFPDLNVPENDLMLDSETINSLTLCLGIMNGVAGANNAIKGMAKALSNGVEKKLLRAALTKGTIYPIVKSVAKWFHINMTKKLFAASIKKAIPVAGGIISGGLTYAMFKPCCYRLKNVLQDTMLSNPDHQSSAEEDEIFHGIQIGIVDVEADELTEVHETSSLSE